MTINTRLTYNSDTNHIGFRSPDRKSDSIGYAFSESIIRSLEKAFQDSIVNEYFEDIEPYIDESKTHPADPNRKIDQLRMKRYHWTIRKPNQDQPSRYSKM
jgi:hypothetical protein